MIPFASWSQSKSHVEAAWETPDLTMLQDGEGKTGQFELSALVDDLLENLNLASIVQLRTSVKMAGKSWSEQQAAKHESFVTAELAKTEEHILPVVANVLLPVLTELQLRQTMEEFSKTLHTLLPEFKDQQLVIKAPGENSRMLQQILDAQGVTAEIVESGEGEISIAGSSVMLVARLTDWCQKLRQAATA